MSYDLRTGKELLVNGLTQGSKSFKESIYNYVVYVIQEATKENQYINVMVGRHGTSLKKPEDYDKLIKLYSNLVHFTNEELKKLPQFLMYVPETARGPSKKDIDKQMLDLDDDTSSVASTDYQPSLASVQVTPKKQRRVILRKPPSTVAKSPNISTRPRRKAADLAKHRLQELPK